MGIEAIVFLDRDGTINVDSGYVFDPDALQLIPRASDAIAWLKGLGFTVVVVSNQSAIGRGMASVEQVELTNSRLCEMLVAENPDAVIDQMLYSPAHPDQGSVCRKPGLGMLEKLELPFELKPERCWVAGDKLSDLEFGENLGIPSTQRILLLTGQGKESLAKLNKTAKDSGVRVCEDLYSAAKIIASAN